MNLDFMSAALMPMFAAQSVVKSQMEAKSPLS